MMPLELIQSLVKTMKKIQIQNIINLNILINNKVKCKNILKK
jgi:hypothetical protein